MLQYPECNLLFVKKNSDKTTIFNKSHVPAVIRGKLFYKLLRKKRLRLLHAINCKTYTDFRVV